MKHNECKFCEMYKIIMSIQNNLPLQQPIDSTEMRVTEMTVVKW